MNSPTISVLMPVYNGEKHVAEAIDSILVQKFSDFEFIIIDDASTDATASILDAYAQQDTRIRILTNTSNRKIAFSLNWGLAEAQAPLIARMDADDWAHPERLTKQYTFMQAHPEVTVCGTWIEVYESGEERQFPCDDATIRAHMIFDSTIAHPTAMFRKYAIERIAGGYDVATPPAEDYDLWARLAAHPEVRFANLSEKMLRYRIHPEKKRTEFREKQSAVAVAVRIRLLERIDLAPTEKERTCHWVLCGADFPATFSALYGCWCWGRKLLTHNARAKQYDQAALRAYLRQAWHNLAHRIPLICVLRKMWVQFAPEDLRAKYRSLKGKYLAAR